MAQEEQYVLRMVAKCGSLECEYITLHVSTVWGGSVVITTMHIQGEPLIS